MTGSSPTVFRQSRRSALARGLAAAIVLATPRFSLGQSTHPTAPPERRWYDAAASMKRLAESWGDQPYGAVLVLDGKLIGEGPSRVVKLRDGNAHAEREAIKDAQRRLNTTMLRGSVLYSTSRPCRLCEAAAAAAGVTRIVYGADLSDAGSPRP